METLRQVTAIGMLFVVLAGAITTLLTSQSGYLAGAIVVGVFMLFFLVVTMEEDYHGKR